MEALLPISGPNPCCSAPPVPTEPCPVRPRLAAEFEPWRQAAYWQSLHQRAVQREQRLLEKVDALQGRIRSLEQRLFGRKTEHAATPPDAASATPPPQPPRPRGQQRGRPGPKRRDYTHLPVVEETLDVPADRRHCPQCGQAFAPFPGTDDGTVLEVEVRAHRRLIRRRRYRPTCGCGCNPGIITAPPPPKLLPKSILGVSIWVRVLLDKYLFYRPTYRLLDDLATEGLPLSLGTITDGLRRLLPLLEPLYDALVERSRRKRCGTPTRRVGWCTPAWKARSATVGICGSSTAATWWCSCWPAVAPTTCRTGRLGPWAEGILVVDRYAAYKALSQVKDGRIVLAFCWAHVRRDFVEAARSWPALERWGLDWVERIGAAYRCNDARLAVRDDPTAFARADQALRRQVAALAEQSATELRQDDLHPARRKTLESLQQHWQGLTVFVDHPDVPMDNNTAERLQRGPVVGRKNYYGSGAEWSGRLAAILFSLFQTLALGRLNPRLWLTAYLEACAAAGGRAPADAAAYLPWNLTEEQKRAWRCEPAPSNTS